MRIPNSREGDNQRDDQSMTAMIDVVFLLLIFFVCATVGQVGELLVATDLSAGNIDVPENEQPIVPKENVTIVITRDNAGAPYATVNRGNDRFLKTASGRFERADEPRALTALLQGIAKLFPDRPVILDIQKNIAMGDVMRVYTSATNAGFSSINFATDE